MATVTTNARGFGVFLFDIAALSSDANVLTATATDPSVILRTTRTTLIHHLDQAGAFEVRG